MRSVRRLKRPLKQEETPVKNLSPGFHSALVLENPTLSHLSSDTGNVMA